MIADLNDSAGTELPDYDVCIIGSGPAGGTVAKELAGSGLRVCVVESGRLRVTRHGDELKRVDSEGIHIKDYSRERVLGGASTTWAGLSSPLDATDLEPRPWLRHSGWPIAQDELFPYYERAAERYRFPPAGFFGGEGFGALRAGGALTPEWEAIEEKVFLACGEPQNFAVEVRDIYERGDVDLLLDATVLRLEGSPDPARVEAAVVRSRGGVERRLQARVFVVAAGGLENARLLLNSRDLCPEGLGNERDQVGRYLMNHPKNYHGIVTLARPVDDVPYFFGCLYKGYAGYAGLRLQPRIQAERELLNSYVRFEPLFPWSDSEGIEALVLLVKRSSFFFRRWKRKRQDEVVTLRDYSETGDDSDLQNTRKGLLDWIGLLFTIALDAPKVARYAFYRLSRAKPKVREVRLRNFMEMEPDPENRVTLSETRDPYGQPIPMVRHACTEADRRSLLALHELLITELPRSGVGSLETTLKDVDPWPITQDASHHMGTTRMGADPSTSVVTPDGRLHSVENVYMAGASVFPTSGSANPTFTIVALSIRLAEHLTRVLAPSRTSR
jgi:choline dehydrogenase-like flavoprotein